MNKQTVRDVDVAGKRVLVRVDFNVPLKDGEVARRRPRGSRECAADHQLPARARRPRHPDVAPRATRREGVPDEPPAWRRSPPSWAPAGAPVAFADDCVGPAAEAAVAALRPGDVLLLENLRFHAEEEATTPRSPRSSPHSGDLYVNDAFGTRTAPTPRPRE